MATEVRTADEAPLDISMVDFVGTLFSKTEHDTFWLATLGIFIGFYLFERVHPNEQPYWKKIIRESARLEKTYLSLEKIDLLCKRLPVLKRYAWNLAVVATK